MNPNSSLEVKIQNQGDYAYVSITENQGYTLVSARIASNDIASISLMTSVIMQHITRMVASMAQPPVVPKRT